MFAGHLYAREILDIKRWKNVKVVKPQNEWKSIDPFAAPFVKPKKTFSFTELRLLFYTRLVLINCRCMQTVMHSCEYIESRKVKIHMCLHIHNNYSHISHNNIH